MAAIFAVTLVFNVGLNLLLIPRYSYFASAALTTASEALNVAMAGWAVRRHVGPLAAWPVRISTGSRKRWFRAPAGRAASNMSCHVSGITSIQQPWPRGRPYRLR